MTSSKKSIIKVQDILMTTPSNPAFDGYDEEGKEINIERFQIQLLFEDGRKYVHPTIGTEQEIKNLENKIRRRGTINLEHWLKVRGVQNYRQYK